MDTDATAPFIVPFEAAREDDFPRIGGKCASLARMIAGGVRVPYGFAITTDAYALHRQCNGFGAEIAERLARMPVDDVDQEEELSREIRDVILAQAMPAVVEQAIRDAYRRLSPEGQLPVAVRSSATAEDLPEASFAGQQDTYLYVVGEDAVVEKVKACWASLFNARAISYRAENKLGEIDVMMSVGVQKMVNAAAAGVAMTLDPINGDRTRIVIDSSFGLGEPVVSGEITPDNFVVEKVLMQILGRRIAEKDFELVADRAARRAVERVIAPERRTLPSLTDAQVIAVAKLAKSLERSTGCPQDVEWAIDADLPEGENLVALQSRPETVWSRRKQGAAKQMFETGVAGVLGTLLAPVQAKL